MHQITVRLLREKTLKYLLSWSCLLTGLLGSTQLYASSAELITTPVFMCGSGLGEFPAVKDKIFESVPTRPLAESDDGSLLYVLNPFDNCLEIYRHQDNKAVPQLISSVAVGVDPVAVAVRNEHEVWVVNHVSDSVSIVDIDGTPHVKQTLLVGDAPWDIVFANNSAQDRTTGENRRDRAFITTSFRGQHHPQFKMQHLLLNRLDQADGKPGQTIGRAELWAFDIGNNGAAKTAGIINTFTSSLRALEVSGDGTRVFATAFKSGNRTAITPVPFDKVLGDKWSADGVAHLEPFAIVQQQDGKWLDAEGNNWPAFMNFDIADNDVFVIDAQAPLSLGDSDTPAFNRHAILQTVEAVGSVLFNSVYDDDSQRLYISAVDAINTVPMEHALKGIFNSNHIKIVDFNGQSPQVTSVDLDQAARASHGKAGYALPAGLMLNGRGLHVAAMGLNELGTLELASLGKKPRIAATQTAEGPIALLESGDGERIYSYNYVANSVSILHDTDGQLTAQATIALSNPEHADIRAGRQFLYDAKLTSNNSRVACASCHIFGGDDRLQWNLSKSGADVLINRLPFIEHGNRQTGPRAIKLDRDPATLKVGDNITIGGEAIPITYMGTQQGFADAIAAGKQRIDAAGFAYLEESAYDKRLFRYKILNGNATWVVIEAPFLHPLKGPMRTTPLHGIVDSGPMHFLGDKFGLVENATGPCSNKAQTQAQRAFKEFNTPCDGSPGPFETLLGGDQLPEPQMDQLSAFSLALSFPPNPIRPLNNQVNERGEHLFSNVKVGTDLSNWEDVLNKKPLVFACRDCHTTSRDAKFFGTAGQMYSAPPLSLQDAKVPHLRYLYDRAGFLRGDYRRKSSDFLNMRQNDSYYDEVVHAQGLNHGGWFDFSMFFADMVWILDPDAPNAWNDASKQKYFDLFSYLMEFDSNYYPMYGQQLTVSATGLRNPTTRAALETYIKNAQNPRSTRDKKQCDIRSTAPHSARSISSLAEVSKAVNASKYPITLTCL